MDIINIDIGGFCVKQFDFFIMGVWYLIRLQILYFYYREVRLFYIEFINVSINSIYRKYVFRNIYNSLLDI